MTISPTRNDLSRDFPGSAELLIKEAQHASRKRRSRNGLILLALLLVISVVVSMISFYSRSGPTPPTADRNPGYSYAPGSSILALKLSRLEMLSASEGVGVAPIVTNSGALVRAYLVRTKDAGARWRVAGALPKGFYPWSTAFMNSREGYVTGSSGAVFTNNGGRTWSQVMVKYSPLSISIQGQVVWIAVEKYCPSLTKGPRCGTYLDTFRLGSLVPKSVSWVPSDQPVVTQLGPTKGYVVGSGDFAGRVYYTNDSGNTWSSVVTPCAHHQISGGSVMSSSKLITYCELGSASNPGTTVLYATQNGGATWQKVAFAPGVGLQAAAGSTGRFLWQFNENGTLSESNDFGRDWTEIPNVKYGADGVITTYGAHEAWHVVTGRGIYWTLNGSTWTLLK